MAETPADPACPLAPEIAARIAPDQLRPLERLRQALGPRGFGGIADLAARRACFREVSALAAKRAAGPDRVERRDLVIPFPGPLSEPFSGGSDIPARLYRPRDAASPMPALVYLHGGGGIMGGISEDDPMAAELAVTSGAAVLSLGYALAPDAPGDLAARQALAALDWLATGAGSPTGTGSPAGTGSPDIDPARLGLCGASAGGGIAAAAALLARARPDLPRLRILMMLYPMLDDRTGSDLDAHPNAPDIGVWDRAANREAWALRRGDVASGAVISPARQHDLSNLPPVYLDIGDLDLFLAETLAFAGRLAAGGVPLTLHVHPGSYHGFDQLAPRAAASAAAWVARGHAIRDAFGLCPPDPSEERLQ